MPNTSRRDGAPLRTDGRESVMRLQTKTFSPARVFSTANVDARGQSLWIGALSI
jgi:hypothetical protein